MIGGASWTPVLLAATDVNYDRSTTTETTVSTTVKTIVTDTFRAAATQLDAATAKPHDVIAKSSSMKHAVNLASRQHVRDRRHLRAPLPRQAFLPSSDQARPFSRGHVPASHFDANYDQTAKTARTTTTATDTVRAIVTRSEASTVRLDGTANESTGTVQKSLPDARLARWTQARATTQRISQVDTITKRWHKDVDSVWKRLLLACTINHTLCAGILYRGSPGYTRAQTVMILVNSFAFELIMLCMFYEVPEPIQLGNTTDGAAEENAEPAMVINPVAIIISSVFAALICIPTMLTFAWLYEPMIFVRLSQWVVRVTFCSPFWLCTRFNCNRARVQIAGKHSSSEGEAEGVADCSVSAEQSPVRAILPASTTPEDNAMAMKAASAVQASPSGRAWPSVSHRAPSEVSPPPSPTPASASPHAASGLSLVVSPSAVSPSTLSPSPKELSSRRSFSYESLNEVVLKASLTRSWTRKDWPAVRKILFGWGCNHLLFFTMLFFFLFYGCEIFEPNLESIVETRRRLARGGGGGGGTGGATSLNSAGPTLRVAGNTDELLIAWALSAFQRFVLHEPTLILAQKGLPMLFASAFCANCCGETIVNALTLFVEVLMAVAQEIRG